MGLSSTKEIDSVKDMKVSVYRKISRRASARVWRGKSVDLEQLGDHQLSVGVEMRSGWPNLQTQITKPQEKSYLERSKFDEGARRLKVNFSDLGLPGRN